jgi:hypothetical protein
MSDINQAIDQFVSEWQRLYDDYMTKNFPNNANPRIEVRQGKKYAKVTREGSVVAFIDLSTGDIFMPASWQKPANHARGNVLSERQGLESLNTTQYHPHVRYLR